MPWQNSSRFRRRAVTLTEPVRADESGITYLPPPVSDPLPKVAAGIGVAAAAAGLTAALVARSRRVKREKEKQQQEAKDENRAACSASGELQNPPLRRGFYLQE